MTDVEKVELIRRAIDEIKSFAESATYADALDLAKQYFINNPNTHDNWEILDEGVKFMEVKLAQAAIYEITTGKEIK